MEAPLLSIDSALQEYCNAHGITLSRNYHNWPNRSIRWGATVSRLLQVFLKDEKVLSWSVWICASEDRGHQRYWKQRMVASALPSADLASFFVGSLDALREEVDSWQPADFEFATQVSG